MRQNLIRRLEKLESRLPPLPVGACWVSSARDDRTGLAENERIVYDLYRQEGLWFSSREHITTDPNDQGRRCPPGRYLEDVIRELHEECEWRDKGCCGICSGLEHLFSPLGPPRGANDTPLTSPEPT
jgi:hypothetical protein